ncbi:uncharacterized protein LOC9659248 isoform X2 [Selaginella moellendorffii]|uniref:uncharacterized protein LOC9659248 isoform X2 n=1 Tax=Selaginella moellendorffii TaxID=88036 RepID=UPI000D1CF729|nr:uncharacterized protein LOC9659248 isoform X2 [Selaginella moellendorffii]|eukprot:XP_024539511.1 uncharacterized protein LOC9659248 isoform X2 [Selaginella moellendorffii]
MRWNNGRRIPSDESDHNAAAAATTGNKEPSINNACERAIDERSKALEIEVPRSPAPPFIQKKSFTKLPLVFARERYVPSLTLHMEEWEWSELSSQLSRVARLDTSKNTGTKSYALIIFLPRRLSGLQVHRHTEVALALEKLSTLLLVLPDAKVSIFILFLGRIILLSRFCNR